MANFTSDEIIKNALKRQGFSSIDGRKTISTSTSTSQINLDQDELQHKIQQLNLSTLDGSTLSKRVQSNRSNATISNASIEKALILGQTAQKDAQFSNPQSQLQAQEKYVKAATILARVLQHGKIVSKPSKQYESLKKKLTEFIRQAERIASLLEETKTKTKREPIDTATPATQSMITSDIRNCLARAVELDQKGDLIHALKEYKLGVSSLFNVLQSIPTTDLVRYKNIETTLHAYMERAEVLKVAVNRDERDDKKGCGKGGSGGSKEDTGYRGDGGNSSNSSSKYHAYNGNANGFTMDCAITDMCAEGLEYMEIKHSVLARFGSLLNKRQKQLIKRLKGDSVPLATDVRAVPVMSESETDTIAIATAKEVY